MPLFNSYIEFVAVTVRMRRTRAAIVIAVFGAMTVLAVRHSLIDHNAAVYYCKNV